MIRRLEQGMAAIGLAALLMAAGCEASSTTGDPTARRAALEALRHSGAAEVYQVCKGSVVNIGAVRTASPAPPAAKPPETKPPEAKPPESKPPETKPPEAKPPESKPPEAKPPETKPPEAKPESSPPPAAPAGRVTQTEFASGFVFDEAGYILTNAHVLRHGGDLRVGFQGGKDYPARVVAFDESKDLAVFRIDPEKPLVPLKFGRSGDLIIGEPILAMGNPFGMGLTISCGIVSALGRATKSDYTFFPDMIQTDAATNPGNSGGPLLNVFGEVVGINTTTKLGANSIGFAIPIDRIREALPEVLDPEGRFAFVVGLRVAADGSPRVTEVVKGSPADAAGVRVGDIILRVGTKFISSGVGYALALVDARAEQPLALRTLRDGQFLDFTLKPAKVEPLGPDKADGATLGLVCDYFPGDWDKMPDFAALKPESSGRADTFDLAARKSQERFALRFTGYVDVPADGTWAFFAASDDGSRLAIGDRVVVDNEGAKHGAERRGFIPLKAGKHAITVTYFQRRGEAALRVSWEAPGVKKQPIPASALSSQGK